MLEPFPSETNTALELLMDDKLNCPYVSHVMIVMWSMTYLWRKKLDKEAELLITLLVRLSFWKMYHHEPLILTCLLPIFKHRNWYGT